MNPIGMDLLLGGERYALFTRLDPEQCRARLQSRTTSAWSMHIYGDPHQEMLERPLRGFVSREGFTVRKTLLRSDHFASQASGRFVAQPGGTLVRMRVGQSYFHWLLVSALAVVLTVPMAVYIGADWPLTILAVLAVMLGYLMLVCMVDLLYDDIVQAQGRELVGIVRSALAAEEIEGERPPAPEAAARRRGAPSAGPASSVLAMRQMRRDPGTRQSPPMLSSFELVEKDGSPED